MLENYVPPVMRATGSEKLSWLDENQNTVQAMEDMAIPNSAGLTVSKVCRGEHPENTKGWLLDLVCFWMIFFASQLMLQPSVHFGTVASVCHVWTKHARDMLMHAENGAVHQACKTAPQQLLHQLCYLLLLQGTTGRFLQKAQYLVEKEHAKHVKIHPLLASESTILVLWLPSTHQRQPKQKRRVRSGDIEDRHLRPGNDILLEQAWACLHQIQQVLYGV